MPSPDLTNDESGEYTLTFSEIVIDEFLKDDNSVAQIRQPPDKDTFRTQLLGFVSELKLRIPNDGLNDDIYAEVRRVYHFLNQWEAFSLRVKCAGFLSSERYLEDCEEQIKHLSTWSKSRSSQLPDALTTCMLWRLQDLMASIRRGRETIEHLRKLANMKTDIEGHAISLIDSFLKERLDGTSLAGKRELVRAAIAHAAQLIPKQEKRGVEKFVHAITMKLSRVRSSPIRQEILFLTLQTRLRDSRIDDP